MSDIVDSLIFDRVQADIDAMTDKAYIDYQDLCSILPMVMYHRNGTGIGTG